METKNGTTNSYPISNARVLDAPTTEAQPVEPQYIRDYQEAGTSITVDARGNSTDKTLEQRGSTYGEFEDNATRSQTLKDDFRRSPNWTKFSDIQREALDLIATKLSRIMDGDIYYADNWRDIAGYAELVVRSL